MERKIGEIFTYKDKTYQVLKAIDGCKGCTFHTQSSTCINESCFAVDREDKTSIIFKEINNMEIKNNQITIDIPKGMEIDIENSDFTKGIIKFKKKDITYDDVVNSFAGINTYIYSCNINKLGAIARLMNIAKYYNKDWKPNWNNREPKYYIKLRISDDTFFVDYDFIINLGGIYFKNLEDARAVVNNPNFKEILDTIYK